MLVQNDPIIQVTNIQPDNRAAKSRQLKMVFRGFLQATALICLMACEDSMVGSLRTDAEIVNHEIGGIELAIPVNYLMSYSKGSAFMIASWPEMEGRTRENYLHYTQSNLGIFVKTTADYKTALKSLAVYYTVSAHDPTSGAPTPRRVGSIYGFEHYEAFGHDNPGLEKKWTAMKTFTFAKRQAVTCMHSWCAMEFPPHLTWTHSAVLNWFSQNYRQCCSKLGLVVVMRLIKSMKLK